MVMRVQGVLLSIKAYSARWASGIADHGPTIISTDPQNCAKFDFIITLYNVSSNLKQDNNLLQLRIYYYNCAADN